MNKSLNYLSIIMCLVAVQLDGQVQHAQVETSFDFVKKNMTYAIEINGIDVSQTNRVYSIPINSIGFDTIEYSFDNESKKWALMKLRQDENYDLSSNSCSFYTIEPKDNPKQGMVRFSIESDDASSYLVGVDGSDMRQLKNVQLDEFFYAPSSAMCPYAAKSLEVRTLKEEVVVQIEFHFLHGELLVVRFDEEDPIDLNLQGYIKDEKD